MADFTISGILTIRDDGSITFQKVAAEADKSGRVADKAGRQGAEGWKQARTAADSAARSQKNLAEQIGFTAMKVVRLMVAYMALRGAMDAIRALTIGGYKAVEDFRLSVVKFSAQIASMAEIPPDKDPRKVF